MSGYRLPAPMGSVLDRHRTIGFDFNGKRHSGFAGDTLASALLANGVRLVGRSFKLHRPRGILSCGVEEPTGLVDVGEGPLRAANTRATDILLGEGLTARSVNCWPGVRFDLASINARFAAWMPAGFYYKTFMWPDWHLFEPIIRFLAGLGSAGQGADPDRYDEVSMAIDVLVVGAGLAGLQAAASAAQSGRSVVLLENDTKVGGWAAMRPAHGSLIDALLSDFIGAGGRLMTRTTALALYDHRFAVAVESVEGAVRERLMKIRASRIVLASGAYERPLLFPDNDRPGVMFAGAVERYAALYGVACGKRVVVATTSDAGYTVATMLHEAGVGIAAIVDGRPQAGHVSVPDSVAVFRDMSIVAIRGARSVAGVTVAANEGGKVQTLDADTIAVHGGFTPNVNLYSQAGGSLLWNEAASMFVPVRQLDGITVVGAAAGAFELDSALAHAAAAGAGSDELPSLLGGLGLIPADNATSASALAGLAGKSGKVFVDFQNDVTRDDIALAARENYRSVEHFKRYTTTGMATDQGKTSNVNALVQLGLATGRAPGAVGTTKFRPPFKPATLSTMVGGRVGERFRPLKQLPARAFHEARGALFEEFGGWERPAAYPRSGESLEQAAQRESMEVRRGVGIFEGSPLGKIEVYGRDAATFLDLMYVGSISTLAVGGARYGVLLNENGVVVDDGIVARLGPNHFLVNTTSGGADRAVLSFEEWLQCEFIDMKVLIVPVTSQWGNVTVSGPHAWQLLEHVGFDKQLAPTAMKHMTLRESTFEGVALRILRASFNGELGYEINLPARRTQEMLDRLWAAGKPFGICSYGVEALMIMRTEKGFMHVGADTDGTTLPGDVGMARGIGRKPANFVGRRSLLRPAANDLERLQLVGVQPTDRCTQLRIGAHLSINPPPTTAEGFITSSCHSPALGQPIALAMLQRGGQRVGERLQAWHLGRSVEVEVVKTPFFDAAGARLNV